MTFLPGGEKKKKQAGEESAVKQAVWRKVRYLRAEKEVQEQQRQEAVDDAVQEAKRQAADKDKENREPMRDAAIRSQNRKGVCGRKRKALGDATVDKRCAKMAYKGAPDHKTYREAVKSAVSSACQDGASGGCSQRSIAKDAVQRLQADGVQLSVRHCCKIVAATVRNGTVPSPQKPGGVFVSSAIEERIVRLIKGYRGRKLPVFADDVMGWCTELIHGTVYEKNFPPDGKATEGWYRKFLERTEMLTGTERPLEITRAEWLTVDNLQRYFEVAEGVLLQAGVAARNPDYDPDVPYSEPVLITLPERIVSFDEYRVELDSTDTSKAKSDRMVRAGIEDRGECLVTKSSGTASLVAGRTGTAKALPPFVVFSSGKSMHPDWCPAYESDVLDAEGRHIPWRYDHNEKGSVNEAKAADYIRNIIHPAVGSPKPRDVDPGNQGVVFCDGVGTHLGITVLETAIELGLEIVLRVPHLSFRLQGEDTHNFGPLKVSVNAPAHQSALISPQHTHTHATKV